MYSNLVEHITIDKDYITPKGRIVLCNSIKDGKQNIFEDYDLYKITQNMENHIKATRELYYMKLETTIDIICAIESLKMTCDIKNCTKCKLKNK